MVRVAWFFWLAALRCLGWRLFGGLAGLWSVSPRCFRWPLDWPLLWAYCGTRCASRGNLVHCVHVLRSCAFAPLALYVPELLGSSRAQGFACPVLFLALPLVLSGSFAYASSILFFQPLFISVSQSHPGGLRASARQAPRKNLTLPPGASVVHNT